MKLANLILEAIIKPINSLGIERKDMPQIDSKDINAFLKHLDKSEIGFSKCRTKASDLKPTQSELDTDKADGMYQQSKTETKNPLQIPILISKDGYVLDGHHRWLAVKRNADDTHMECIEIDAKAEDCLDIMHGFSKSVRRDINDKKMAEAYLFNHSKSLVESSYTPIGIKFDKLRKHKVNLTQEERQTVKDGGAEWGNENSAIMKSVIDGKEYFTTYTHRAYNCCNTLDQAIERFHAFIKETA